MAKNRTAGSYARFSDLIVRTYPNLPMLNGVTFNENEISRYLQLAQNTPLRNARIHRRRNRK